MKTKKSKNYWNTNGYVKFPRVYVNDRQELRVRISDVPSIEKAWNSN